MERWRRWKERGAKGEVRSPKREMVRFATERYVRKLAPALAEPIVDGEDKHCHFLSSNININTASRSPHCPS